jgi:hypothetical protein
MDIFDHIVQQVEDVDRFGAVYVRDLKPPQQAAGAVLKKDRDLASIETDQVINAVLEDYHGNARCPCNSGPYSAA